MVNFQGRIIYNIMKENIYIYLDSTKHFEVVKDFTRPFEELYICHQSLI